MRVAIIGAGPCGSALATFLARQGAEVALFDDGRRPELLVGESLVPAVTPILERLGIEEETATFGLVKPGVSFIWSPTDRFSFTFARFAPAVPPYAYNIPRPRFDEALLAKAVAAGVNRTVARARLEPTGRDGAELALAPETLAAAPMLGGRQPDLIVDATGRARLSARALRIPAQVGPRNDVAHFAHFEGWSWDDAPGQVLIARLKAGWSWCIPFKERLSVGIVVGREDADRLAACLERLNGPAFASLTVRRPGQEAPGDRRRRQARDVGRHVLELSADLATGVRSRLGHGGRRLRLRRSDAVPRRLSRAALGGARRRGPQPVPAATRDSVGGRARLGAPLVRRRPDLNAGRMVGSRGLFLRRADAGPPARRA